MSAGEALPQDEGFPGKNVDPRKHQTIPFSGFVSFTRYLPSHIHLTWSERGWIFIDPPTPSRFRNNCAEIVDTSAEYPVCSRHGDNCAEQKYVNNILLHQTSSGSSVSVTITVTQSLTCFSFLFFRLFFELKFASQHLTISPCDHSQIACVRTQKLLFLWLHDAGPSKSLRLVGSNLGRSWKFLTCVTVGCCDFWRHLVVTPARTHQLHTKLDPPSFTLEAPGWNTSSMRKSSPWEHSTQIQKRISMKSQYPVLWHCTYVSNQASQVHQTADQNNFSAILLIVFQNCKVSMTSDLEGSPFPSLKCLHESKLWQQKYISDHEQVTILFHNLICSHPK